MDPVTLARIERTRDIWLSLAVVISALTGAANIAFLTAVGYENQRPWLALLVGLAGIVAMAWVWPRYNGARRVVAAHNPDASGVVPLEYLSVGGLDALARRSPEVMRLLHLVAGVSKDLQPDASSFTFDSGGALTSYRLTATRPGVLTPEPFQAKLHAALTRSMEGTGWDVQIRSNKDEVLVSRGSEIPRLALPEIWPVVTSAAEAKTRYTGWQLELGPGEQGPVRIDPQVFPHMVAVASTGGGKSVFLRSSAEQFRAIGAQIYFGDGKGSDYAAYRGQSNVVAIGRGSGARGMEYAAIIEMCFRIMQARQDGAAEAKLSDPDGWKNFAPIFVILDEMKAVLKKWKSELKSAEFKLLESRMNQVLALGREFRVHVCFAVQDVYAESIPRPWLSNVGLKVSLGKPHAKTLEQGFDEAVQDDARRVAERIDPRVRGRGMIAGYDDDTGSAQVVEYQGFLSYAPGESIEGAPAEAQQAMQRFKRGVSDAVPNLYSRKWFRITSKPSAQVALEKRRGADLGYIDFELFTPTELADLPIVNLDMRDDRGEIVPDPKMRRFDPDPQNVEYVCRPVRSETDAITDI
ncbi:type IV secretory system conjugative DNA transfer family protein [Corynebacterium sp. AOP12-C2-36]|uniref:type IV secretory system conjugative DNA transfer family protein n=1 Tax=Corynebacterium sp. AOP12-C2-36 TaxID=3457723 RepID=UPI0040347622